MSSMASKRGVLLSKAARAFQGRTVHPMDHRVGVRDDQGALKIGGRLEHGAEDVPARIGLLGGLNGAIELAKTTRNLPFWAQ